MGYVHSPHDHPEQDDRELAAAISVRIIAKCQNCDQQTGIYKLNWNGVDPVSLGNCGYCQQFLGEFTADELKHADATQQQIEQEEGHDHGNER